MTFAEFTRNNKYKVQDAWHKLFLIPEYLGPKEFEEKIKKQAEENHKILKDIGMAKN